MKAINLALAMVAPVMLGAGYLPEDKIVNSTFTYELNIENPVGYDGNFRLPKQPYYTDLFTKKELKKLAKAEKLREEASEGLVLAAAYQKQADDLKTQKSAKIAKEMAKLEAKGTSQELKAFKAFEKASDIYREVYTNELNNKTFSNTNDNQISAQKLAKKAQVYYQVADEIKDKMTSENTLTSYRQIYTKLNSAVFNQEIAFAVYQDSATVDLSKYINTNEWDTSANGNVPNQNIPSLVAREHYDFERDNNIYRQRYHNFEEKLKVSDEDKQLVRKYEESEANATSMFSKAESFGCSADTMRIYAQESTTLTEKEYYEQKAQEQELNECSNLLKAIKLEINVNNGILDIYKKYIPNVRDEKNTVGKNYEEQAEVLYELSKTYETLAAKQFSMVEQYTQLSEGNEVKLQAIHNMENAIASYLGDNVSPDKLSLASGATEKNNGIAMDYQMIDESDGSESVPVANNGTAKKSEEAKKDSQKSDSAKPESQNNAVVADNTSKPADNKADKTSGKNNSGNNSNIKPSGKTGNETAKNNNSGKSTSKNGTNSNKNSGVEKAEKAPVANSNAAVVSTWYYTRSDERLKPYSFPAGTIFSVQVGQYKEMPEPVEFPAIETFIAENLKNQTYMKYYLGAFKTYEAAYAAQAMAKREGYKKSVIVAFVSGKKSDVNAAKNKAEKAAGYQTAVQNELKHLNANIAATTPVSAPAAGKGGAAVPLSGLSSTVYAVQISSVPTFLNASAFNVDELYYDQNGAGLYRYYTGVSSDINIAKTNLQTMKSAGYEDAYLIKVVDGKNSGAVSSNNNNVAPYTLYRVQIGAYKAALTSDTQKRINNLKNRGYAVHKSQSGEYTVFTVGDCESRDKADKLRAELLKLGYTESYVVRFVNGVKQ
ncbi:MAG: SPOR domain-containing protein [Bacteroidales bacterium]|nr:SPOR domain-containing protein [Bacteroidales bacterium]